MIESNKRILIVDALNIFLRNFAANPTTSQNGEHIGGFLGTLKFLQKILRECKPDYVFFCWDGEGGSKKRKSLYKDYKDGRKPMRFNRSVNVLSIDQEIKNKLYQVQRLMEYINDMPVAQIMLDNIEADDIVAFLCRYMPDNQKIIVSSDKDFYQLLDTKTLIYRPAQKQFFSTTKMLEEIQIHPNNFALAKAITGDPSDNIHGVKGAGFKTLAKRFPELAGDKDITINNIVDLAKENKEKFSVLKNIVESKKVIEDNYRIIQLYNSSISVYAKNKIKEVIENYPTGYSKTELLKKFISDGVNDIEWNDLFTCLNKISKQ